MAEATLSLTLDLLRQQVADYHNWGTSGATPDLYYSTASAKERGLIDDEIRRGLRQFYNPQVLPGESQAHRWSFLTPAAEITVFKAVSGTMSGQPAGVPSVCTITTALFLAAHVGQKLKFSTSGNTYKIIGFTSTTIVTVDGDATAETSGDTVTIDADDYMLPDLFGAIVGNFTYAPEQHIPPIRIVGEGKIRELRQANVGARRPELAAVRPLPFNSNTGQRWELMLWPAPDASYTLGYIYQVLQDNLTTASGYFPGGAQHGETLIQSVLSISEQRKEGFRSYHHDRFMETLIASILFDRQSGPSHFGYNVDRSDDRTSPRRSEHNNVTYDDTLY